MHAFPRSLLAVAVGAVVLAGCAEELPPINRVQPNYYEKSFFIGADFSSTVDDPEFYSQGTLVDVGYGAGQDGLFTSTYAQPLTRVRWTVTEDLLIARLAYERVANSDGKGVGRATNDGTVVAAYPITRHFDIQRQYNPSTGEQTNVIEENTSDRPWYERQYFRVDWSRNLSTDNYDYDTLSQLGIYGGVTYEPLAYDVTDPSHPDHPRYVPDQGYLDITNKAWARPQLVDISHLGWGLGVVPACWFDADFMNGTAPATGCAPVELTIRQSFLRTDMKKSQDYEPQDWDGYRFQAFGAFTTERYGYARNYGMTDTQWHRFINRYNIWERSHYYTDLAGMNGAVACFTPATTPAGKSPHRDEDGDGTEDECKAVGKGSRCDEFSQKCTLPYRDRTPKTIAWYYANESHPDFWAPTYDATHEWDVALRSAVQVARYSECVKTGGTVDACSAQYPVYNGGQDENDDAIALAREVDECRAGRGPNAGGNCLAVADKIGTERGYSAGVIALAKMEEMVVLCHSPVEANDPAACAPQTSEFRLDDGITAAQCDAARNTAGADAALLNECNNGALNVRRGDLRYHQVNAIKTPQTPSPWGIMVDSNDPLTGETIAASINVWTHVNDLWAQGIVDTARYIKGELSSANITEGTYIRDWAKAAEAASRRGALPLVSKMELRQKIGEFSRADAKTVEGSLERAQFMDPHITRQLKSLNRELDSIRADVHAPSTTKPVYEARRQKAVGSLTEAHLTTPMMQSYAGMDGIPNSEVVMNFASPLRGANPSIARELERMKELAYAERGACMMHEAPAPFAIADLSGLLEAKFGAFNKDDSVAVQHERAAKMQKYLARKAHYAVITHEMGHSVGLRHNFVSSSDAFNYRPQYWQLRTDNGTNTVACTDVDPTGGCVGPRYFDPVTENERKNLITMFMQSSTMDYAGEALQDLLGLGAYDFAAARMFYADTAAVLEDDSYKVGTPRGIGILEKQDNFGGILGIRPSIGTGFGTETNNFHYSQLEKEFDLIWGCRDIDPMAFKPSTWDTATMGEWHPLLDGQFVQVNGKYSRCRQQRVDYVQWDTMRPAGANEVGFGRGGPGIDKSGRTRFPYGFATDRWADLGNLSVYRHDNGADAYELFDFLITQQEVNHIFDNYRRGRQTFTVRGAANRALGRYNAKMRDGAKGLGLMSNIYKDFANDMGYDFEGLWPYIANQFFADNILASAIAFDHFARQMARPASGPHYLATYGAENKRVLRSATDAPGNGGATVLNVPNGATGLFQNVVPGGRPLENSLAADKGEYDSEYTIWAGSYYDKAWSTMLFTESVDNFISDSRRDFLDSRYRAVSLADLFPDGYRRWLANNLTGDEEIKATRIATSPMGLPVVDGDQYPTNGIGWLSWTDKDLKVCFQQPDNLLCQTTPPANTVPLESQVGWEQQKFLIAWTLMYLPENQQQTWLNQMNIWEIGADTDPGFQNRIEFHAPNGKRYVAKTFGKEVLFGKTVQKGISARILEYANELLANAYETDPGPDLDNDGKADWNTVKLGTNGQPVVKFDPSIRYIDPATGNFVTKPGCSATDNSQCTCTANRACIELEKYEEIPFFMRQAMRDYGLADPTMKGLY